MIKFLGIGGAFNTKLGNNSGYIKSGDSMLLIDCGGTVFSRLRELNLLEDVKNIHIVITHTHPDHVGSLGDLIFYCHYILKIKPYIYFPENNVLENLLTLIGVKSNMYTHSIATNNVVRDKNQMIFYIDFVKAKHTKTIPAYGFYLKIDGKTLYYSGDSNSISEIALEQLKNGEIDFFYQDVTSLDYIGSGHMFIGELYKVIPENFRGKVYCMHLNEDLIEEEILIKGFSIAPLV